MELRHLPLGKLLIIGKSYIWLLMNRKQKERHILKLYEDGYNYAYITKHTKSSATTVRKILAKNEKLEASNKKSTLSKALEMYEKNYSPLDVAIGLNISADDALSHQSEFWKLKGAWAMAQFYKECGQSLANIVRKIHELGIGRISLAQLLYGLQLANRIPQLQSEEKRFKSIIYDLENGIVEKQHDENRVSRQLNEMRDQVIALQSSVGNLRNEKKFLDKEHKNRYSTIEMIDNSPSYEKTLENVHQKVAQIIGNENKLIYIATISIILTVANNSKILELAKNTRLDTAISYLLNESKDPSQTVFIKECKATYDELVRLFAENITGRITYPEATELRILQK